MLGAEEKRKRSSNQSVLYYFSTTVGGRDLQRFASFCRDLLAMKMPYGLYVE